ncbi:MAG: enoyl-CoA hydratase-related protein [bacterium]
MNTTTIELNIDLRGVAYLTLARADKHNSMDATMLDELAAASVEIDRDASVRAVVLSGAGRSFCAGVDLGWMRRNLELDLIAQRAESQRLSEALHRFARLSKPLIAKVNGHAFAGGVGLICACDIAIGARDAQFSLTETRLGLAPANVAPYVIARMGARNARRCMLTSHRFGGDEAVALGLLDQAVDAAELDAAVERELAEALACAPGAIAATKKMIARIVEMDYAHSTQYATDALVESWQQGEVREGIAAFLDKRKPSWDAEESD